MFPKLVRVILRFVVVQIGLGVAATDQEQVVHERCRNWSIVVAQGQIAGTHRTQGPR